MPSHNTDQSWMLHALMLAARATGHCAPNPLVGCVIVKNNQLISEGWHQGPGTLHAETMALESADGEVNGATLYVNLEPCCHYGRTPPCSQAVIKSGIKRLVIAHQDPNPLVAGKGLAEIEQAGIELTIGVCEQEARHLNRFYLHAITQQIPYVIAKWAMSLDGKLAVNNQDDPSLSGEQAKVFTHQLRQQVDAIIIGANTARVDNPQLTVRHGLGEHQSAKHPLRIILQGKNPLPKNLRLLSEQHPGKTLIFKERNGKINLTNLLNLLYSQYQVHSILVEGGSHTLNQFISEDLVDELHSYITPTLIANLAKKKTIKLQQQQLGNDIHCTAYLRSIPCLQES